MKIEQTFESQTLLAFTTTDRDLDSWLSNIDSNSTPGDEFALFTLCQMYTRHALIITSNQTWTSVHLKHSLDDHDLRRKCDLHLIYLGGDAFGILKPKFEWKANVLVGHIEMIEPPDKPLQDTTDETLSREARASNTSEIKEEPVDPSVHVATELLDVTQSPSEDLPDATTNLIVALPPDMQLTLDHDPPMPQAASEIMTRPCSVRLSVCDIVVSRTITPTPIEVNVVVNHTSYELRAKDSPKRNKATSTTRSRRSVSQNVSYVNLLHDSSSEDTTNEAIVQPLGSATKREPSHYRLAAHKYMLARRRGIITGPKVRTRASTTSKQKVPSNENSNENTDSDATIIVEESIKPPVHSRRKITGRNKKSTNRTNKKTFVTKTYILRKGGSVSKPKKKRRKPYLFKC